MRSVPFVGFVVSILAVLIVPGAQSRAQNTPRSAAPEAGKPASAKAASDMLRARFQATAYEVEAAPEHVSSLDGKTLAASAATAETLLEVLSAFGKARILYRIDQPVNVFSDRIQIGAKEPVITGTRRTATGEIINMTTYHNVGLIVQLSAQKSASEPARETPDVALSIELATLSQSEKEVVPGHKAATTRNVALQHTEPLKYDQPSVMLSVSSASEDDHASPKVYLIRYLFNAAAAK